MTPTECTRASVQSAQATIVPNNDLNPSVPPPEERLVKLAKGLLKYRKLVYVAFTIKLQRLAGQYLPSILAIEVITLKVCAGSKVDVLASLDDFETS